MTYQMMAKSKYGMSNQQVLKTEEDEQESVATSRPKKSGVYFEAMVEELKEQTSKMLKKCKRNKAQIEKLEVQLYGLPQKEIDQNKKLLESNKRMKKNDPVLNEKVELHKVAPSKIILKDKTAALAKKQFVSIMKKPKKKKRGLKSIDGASTIGGTSAMSSTILTNSDDMGMDLDDDGLNMDATMKTNGIEFGEDGEPLDDENTKDDDAEDEGEEGKEEEGGEEGKEEEND